MMATPTKRAVFIAGKLTPRREKRPCTHEHHQGPFLRCPEQDLDALFIELGLPTDDLLPQYHCLACGSTRGFSRRDLRRAS